MLKSIGSLKAWIRFAFLFLGRNILILLGNSSKFLSIGSIVSST